MFETMFSSMTPSIEIVKLKDEVRYTKNLFGTIDELKVARLKLVEKNFQGDCLCLANNEYLVDVDHRDIEEIIKGGD